MFESNICRALLGFSLLASAVSPALGQSLPIDADGRATLERIIAEAKDAPNRGHLRPIVRIVSPLADSSIAGGTSTPSKGAAPTVQTWL